MYLLTACYLHPLAKYLKPSTNPTYQVLETEALVPYLTLPT